MLHMDAADSGPLMGVAVGAVLATVGGLLGGQIENRQQRTERELSAALLFGEILAALRLIVRLADESRGRGNPYGPITMRIVTAAQRETVIYDRNRETLFAIRDPLLRAKTHILLLQMSLTLEAILEGADALRGAAPDEAQEAAAQRASSFDYLLELHAELPPLISRFEMIARQKFDTPELAMQQGRSQITERWRPPETAAPTA